MRVLYVEDDARDIDLASRALARRAPQVSVDVARSLAEARARLEKEPPYDLMLLDLSLPDGDGLELVGELREQGVPVALVVMTGADSPERAVAALKAGADDYVVKRDDYLDRLPGVLAAAQARFRAETDRRTRPLRVLYAEDSTTDADLTRRHFARYAPQIRLETVPSTRVLLDRLAKMGTDTPPFDVLLLDSRPTEIGTLEVLKLLRAEPYSDLPVVQITGQGDGEAAAQALRFGAAHYLVKHPGYLFVLPAVLEAARDSAERARAERAQRESERRYRALVDAVPGAVYSFRVDAGGMRSMPFISEGITRLSGVSAAAVMADAEIAFERIPPEATEALEQSIMTSLVDLSPWVHEFPIRTMTGEELWLRGNSQPVREADGSTIWHGVFVDITDRKKAEQALRESEQRYERVVRHISDALILDDVAGRVLYANQRFFELFGLQEKALPSLMLEDYVAPEWRDRLRARHDQRMRGEEEPDTFEYEGLRPDGTTMWLEARVTTVVEEGRIVGTQSAIRDISARVRAEQERRSLETQLRQAQKMEALGNLAGGIAHDFNNLLTVITSYAELAVQELREHDPLHGMIEEIQRAGKRAAALTQQILAFSRRQVRQPAVLDLNTVVADVARMLQRLIGADIRLTVVPADDLRPIEADPGQIEQVIINLVVNARDAMPEGGTLTIETGNVRIDESCAGRHPSVPPGSYSVVRIIDTGTGMDAATRERLFEPFFTTKAPGKGTGLGLSIVYGIVEQSGGRIEVDSEVGKGTTFSIYLPQVNQVAREAAGAVRVPPAGGGETILVVDDEEAIRSLTRHILTSTGYTVLSAASGHEALRMLEQHDHRVHLLLTDVAMPEMSGRELAERLRMIDKELKVLFMSGYTDDPLVRRAAVDASVPFISKPFALAALTRKIREVLNADLSEAPR